MKEIELKKIDPGKVFKITTLISVFISIIAAIILLILGLLNGPTTLKNLFIVSFINIFLISPLIGLALAIISSFYNRIAKKSGGIRLTLDIHDKSS